MVARGRLRPLKPTTFSRVALVAAVALGLLAAWHFGIFQRFASPTELKLTLVELGALGYLVFVLSYALLQPFGVPGTVFIMVAPLIWPWPVAFALSMTGTMAASVVGFSFARFVARDAVAKRIPARLKKYEAALERRGFTTVALLRFIFWMPPMLHAFFGISRVRFGTHFWGSLVGYLLPIFMVSYFGERLYDMLSHLPATVWLGVLAFTALLAVAFWRRRSFNADAPGR